MGKAKTKLKNEKDGWMIKNKQEEKWQGKDRAEFIQRLNAIKNREDYRNKIIMG